MIELESAIDAIRGLLVSPEFASGLIAGGAALLFALVVGLGRGGRGWGLAVAAATFAAVHATFGRRLSLTAGLVILLTGGWLLERYIREGSRSDLPLAWALIFGGAILSTMRGGIADIRWVQISMPVLILVFGYWLGAWQRMAHSHLLGPLFAISAFGIWATVPETNTARILLAVALVLSIATTRRIDMRTSLAGAFVVAATVAWVGADGGATRPGAIVGAWGTAGMLMILPWFRHGESAIPGWLVIALHTGLVLLSSRVFGLWEGAAPAAFGVIAAVLAVAVLLFILVPTDARAREVPSGAHGPE